MEQKKDNPELFDVKKGEKTEQNNLNHWIIVWLITYVHSLFLKC